MADEPSPPVRFAPLQRLTAEPITDPAEQAALDERRRAWRAGIPPDGPDCDGQSSLPMAPAQILECCDRMPAGERLALFTELFARLTPSEQADLLKQLAPAARGVSQKSTNGSS